MTEPFTAERPEHPATSLVEAFERWVSTPPGERTSRLTIDVVDSVNIRVRPVGLVVELTGRQTARLAAALAGAPGGYVTDSADGLAFWVGRDWAPRPGEQPAATLLFKDLRITDHHLDWGEKPYLVRAPVGRDRIEALTGFVAAAAEQLLFEREAMLSRARWKDGQQVRVRRSGGTGVVSEVHVHLPSAEAAPIFSYLVRLNTVDVGNDLVWLDEADLAPVC